MHDEEFRRKRMFTWFVYRCCRPRSSVMTGVDLVLCRSALFAA